MGKSKNNRGSPATTASSPTPVKVKGLLDIMEAEVTGQDWALDNSDPLAFLGLGLGASPEAKHYAFLGFLAERQAELEKRMSDIKPKPARGRPSVHVSIDEKRAASVLGARDLYIQKTGRLPPSQKELIELAIEIDKILFESGHRKSRLFLPTLKRIQTSVSAGLAKLRETGGVFSIK